MTLLVFKIELGLKFLTFIIIRKYIVLENAYLIQVITKLCLFFNTIYARIFLQAITALYVYCIQMI
jgi:hypothetical protein